MQRGFSKDFSASSATLMIDVVECRYIFTVLIYFIAPDRLGLMIYDNKTDESLINKLYLLKEKLLA